MCNIDLSRRRLPDAKGTATSRIPRDTRRRRAVGAGTNYPHGCSGKRETGVGGQLITGESDGAGPASFRPPVPGRRRDEVMAETDSEPRLCRGRPSKNVGANFQKREEEEEDKGSSCAGLQGINLGFCVFPAVARTRVMEPEWNTILGDASRGHETHTVSSGRRR
jgi:hypothetical protein